MQRDIATVIAVRILDAYNPSGKYDLAELNSLAQLISGVIKEEQSKVGSSNFID